MKMSFTILILFFFVEVVTGQTKVNPKKYRHGFIFEADKPYYHYHSGPTDQKSLAFTYGYSIISDLRNSHWSIESGIIFSNKMTSGYLDATATYSYTSGILANKAYGYTINRYMIDLPLRMFYRVGLRKFSLTAGTGAALNIPYSANMTTEFAWRTGKYTWTETNLSKSYTKVNCTLVAAVGFQYILSPVLSFREELECNFIINKMDSDTRLVTRRLTYGFILGLYYSF